jgi:hypothetical protein
VRGGAIGAHDTLRPVSKVKKEPRKDRGAAGRLAALLDAGDHRAARAEAALLLADPAAPEADRNAAAAVLSSLRPEPAALAVGLAGLVAALLITARVLLG